MRIPCFAGVQENTNLGGKQMWETFLVKELPGPLEAELSTDGQRAIAGMSMSATPEQMWGPRGGEYNIYNDALINSDKLRGTDLYISNASGLSGEWESVTSPRFKGLDDAYLSLAMTETIVTGGLIEAATNKCTHDLKAKLDRSGIPADWNLRGP